MKLSFILASVLALSSIGQAYAQSELQARPSVPPAQPLPPAPPALLPSLQSEEPTRYTSSSLSLEAGWGAPYGWGVTYAYQLQPSLDVNAGLGLGVGGKIGVGLRYYLRPQNAFSPYFGVNVARSGRIDNVEVTLNTEQATYSMAPSGVVHLRSGLRWQPGRLGMLGTLGYGARFTGDPVTFHNGHAPSAELRNLVQIISPGGVEISLGLIINLGR